MTMLWPLPLACRARIDRRGALLLAATACALGAYIVRNNSYEQRASVKSKRESTKVQGSAAVDSDSLVNARYVDLQEAAMNPASATRQAYQHHGDPVVDKPIMVDVREETIKTGDDPDRKLAGEFNESIWSRPLSHKFNVNAGNKISPASLNLNARLPRVSLSPGVVQGIEKFVFFIGYPRSCHSLVASLLDAHPHMVIAHEYELGARFSRDQKVSREKLFRYLYAKTQVDVKLGNRHKAGLKVPHTIFKPSDGYTYNVPGQWQGNFSKTIKVIGDKKGGRTVEFLTQLSRRKIFAKLLRKIALPPYVIHVVRNPFDIISTLLLRSHGARFSATKSKPVKDHASLRNEISHFFGTVEMIVRCHEDKRMFPHIFDMHTHEFKQQPAATLQKMCKFLDVECSEGYLRSCAAIVKPGKSRTRELVVWPEDMKERVLEKMKNVPFMKDYTFHSD
ncbi:uncharacterized protein LOC135831071 [Sycon ciliatum]|uniref:uncharacterized protein LOC135831071 n=1 Tax=Sycon ciliatum TaxID=27933 RepID=UPI0031F65258